MTVAVSEPLPVPEVGEMLSQEAFLLADQVRPPPPVLEMLRVCELELLSPCTTVNERLAGLVLIIGGNGGDGIGIGSGAASGVSRGISDMSWRVRLVDGWVCTGLVMRGSP